MLNTFDNLPWLHELRSHQVEPIGDILEHYKSGVKVVVLDGPTGTGKTLIGEMVRREMGAKGLYVCSTKTLQDQVADDFPSAVLKGRNNYSSLTPFVKADSCIKLGSGRCVWCEDIRLCPYEVAKHKALESDLAVLNTSYLLTEGNYQGRFSKQQRFVVADECDLLEKELMRFAEFNITEGACRKWGLHPPKKGSRKGTLTDWLKDTSTGLEAILRKMVKEPITTSRAKSVQQLTNLINNMLRVVEHVAKDHWIRDNSAGPLVLKPVVVDDLGGELLWRHGKQWLLMSATVISAQVLLESLGWEDRFEVVKVPSTFPVDNRPVWDVGLVELSNKSEDGDYRRVVDGCQRILDLYPQEKVLIHTVSYKLTAIVAQGLKGRKIFSYTNGSQRQKALDGFEECSGPAVLIAPSLDRGIDLPEDLCRVVIVAKVPYPNLGDVQTGARLHLPGGQIWYTVETIRTIVQMSGRAVRSKDDWAHTFILDRRFRGLYRQYKHLFPKWYQEAVKVRRLELFEMDKHVTNTIGEVNA